MSSLPPPSLPPSTRLGSAQPWAFALLLACLGMLGPFAIDTYLPAFASIATSLQATPLQMQQTLSAYLLGFAVMNLFHGALADSLGRRPVVLVGVAVFTMASVGCTLSQTIEQLVFFRALQGLATGAGIVVSRAVIRDVYPPAQAQRVMSQVTLLFGIAPVIAPILGGVLYVHLGWRAVFGFLASVGALLWLANWRLLPETLAPEHVQPFNVRHLMRGYAQLLGHKNFVLLALASGVPFNGMFLYVLGAPAFLGELLQLQPTQFYWFFCSAVAGIMGGAALSGRLAGRITPRRQIGWGFRVMVAASLLNIAANHALTLRVAWALPLIGAFALGWSLMVPAVTLLVLDLVPQRRGLASSLLAVIGSVANALVAGALVPSVMYSSRAMAWTCFGLMGIGLISWLMVRRRVVPMN